MSTTPDDEQKELSRRVFLTRAGSAGIAASAVLGTVGTVVFSDLSVTNERAPRVKLGRPDDFPMGTRRYLDGPRVFIGRDAGGLYAVSAICTHLGCIVRTEGAGYSCPCHGSRYDATGSVVRGPAPRSLQPIKLTLEANGSLYADLAHEVDAADRVVV